MDIFSNLSSEFQSISLLLLIVNAVVHLIFAGAVAKDAGRLVQKQHPVHLVSPMTWGFATLVGGVFVAAVYWFMHHITFRPFT